MSGYIQDFQHKSGFSSPADAMRHADRVEQEYQRAVEENERRRRNRKSNSCEDCCTFYVGTLIGLVFLLLVVNLMTGMGNTITTQMNAPAMTTNTPIKETPAWPALLGTLCFLVYLLNLALS